DGYRCVSDVVRFIRNYARVIDAPVQTHTCVTSLRHADPGYVIDTDGGEWRCETLVVATGACNIAAVPACAEGVPPSIRTLAPLQYRTPEQLDPGGVVIVGASAHRLHVA